MFKVGVLCNGFLPGDIAAGLEKTFEKLDKQEQWQLEQCRSYYSRGRNARITQAVYPKLVDKSEQHTN